MFRDLAGFHTWLAERERVNDYAVSTTPLTEMEGWRLDSHTGDLVHRSGKFFSVRGLEVSTDHRAVEQWSQPIILQPEIGILGILVKMFGGRPYCLMQAKMEPGNVNLLQLSPTVQATRSNYTRVHQGAPVPYLEHFTAPRRGRVVFDALQSEQGSWFLGKRNRNMIVEVTGDVPVLDDFCWLGLDQLAELMTVPNLVNMDSRTVLSGMRFFPDGHHSHHGDRYGATARSGYHSVPALLSWFTEVKSRYSLGQRVRPLAEVPHWSLRDGEIVHDEGRYFSVMGVDVQASNREVASWSQPMLKPSELGLIAFLGRSVGGVFHVLVHAKTEAGTHDVLELGPTVSCIPANYAGQPPPRYLAEVQAAADLLVDVVHSEEGGRFYHAESRYVVADVGPDFPLEVPPDYCWMTVEQLTGFVRYGNHVNVAARCLLSCLSTAPAALAAAA